jgi:hypothetical protein
MNEEVEVKINLSSIFWEERYPGARVYINDNLIFDDLVINSKEIFWQSALEEGDHKIVIEMHNKKEGDTVLDSEDNILKDVILNIDNISIDDIDLDQLLHTNSTYYPQSEYAPGIVKECVNLGWNGRWELAFSSPVYLWFLENL